MNRYKVEFFAFCPVNDVRIKYTLRIKLPSAQTVMAEDLVDAVKMLDRGIHEEFADQLHHDFGGRQTLSAHHHGVCIKTKRGY